MSIQRNVSEPKRAISDFDILWNGVDSGLIAAWESGREMADEAPTLVARAVAGELVVLPWRGGVEKAIKSKTKYGSFLYVAMLQGLMGQDLDIDATRELTIVCSRTGVPVTFTSDTGKYGLPQTE